MIVSVGIAKQRVYGAAIAGWAICGLAVLTLSISNEQRFNYVMIGGGVVTALQGLWELVRAVRALPGNSNFM
jgi:hypothetical protein